MIIIKDINNIEKTTSNNCISIGNFDGMHKGHIELVKETVRIAKENNLVPTVLTFDQMPEEYFKANDFFRLMEMSDKYKVFEKLGVEQVLVIPFDKSFSEIKENIFIKEILIEKLSLKYLIVGKDFKFGYKRMGNIELLQKYSELGGYNLLSLDLVKISSDKISSRDIRILIKNGKIKEANQLLAVPFSLSGKVIHGEKRGRRLGYPTANIEIYKSYPINGIFLVNILFEDKKLFGLASWGNKPTFSGIDHVLEVNILDFESDIYGKQLKVIFIDKIRDQIKFDNQDELIEQMNKDKKTAEILLKDLQ
jgi:riboflavin kinase/FMN adenylyltransferase|tara:strand:+ start:432 stop:1355 length:924 start_codon:yes stop_codon:yes gene_type:complete